MNDFTLDPQLAKDCIELGNLRLCKLLLMNNKQYPWLILVPRQSKATEIHHLGKEDQISLIMESNLVARLMEKLFAPDKLNSAAIGNVVSQLHIHYVARYKTDQAWPKPVWGHSPAIAYEDSKIKELTTLIQDELAAYLKKPS